MDRVKDKEVCGTIGEKLRIEAFKIYLKDTSYGNILYNTHLEELGWGQSVYNGKESGTTALQLRTEAFTVELDNKASELFDVMYQAHIQDIGWRCDGRYLPRQDDMASVAYWPPLVPGLHVPYGVLVGK